MNRIGRQLSEVVAALAAAVLASASYAHHSFGEFDQQNAIELEGVLTRVDWQNPHVHLVLQVPGQEPWRLESAGPNLLLRMGVQKGQLRTGQRVRVVAYPSRQKERYAYTANLLTQDGAELVLFRNLKPRWNKQAVGFGTASDHFSAAPEATGSAGNRSIFGVWASNLANPDASPESLARGSENYPYTAVARQRREDWLRTKRPPVEGCVPKGMPLIMEQPFPIQFADRGHSIELRLEEYDVLRTIRMDAPIPVKLPASRPLGYSFGRWEGATLVVETLAARGEFLDQHGTPQGAAARFVERYTPSADGRRLDYVLRVTDPEIFTQPVEMRRAWLARPDQRLLPFHCKP